VLASEQQPVRIKSPEAFRTISEVSTELDLPQHVLRFWEGRFAQVKPVKRAGGRRYYRPEDVDLLRGIRTLLYGEGFTIKGVQKILRERGLRHVAEIGRLQAPEPVERRPVARPRETADCETTDSQLPLLASNVIPLERTAPVRGLDAAEAERLEMLLRELLALRGRLQRAMRRAA